MRRCQDYLHELFMSTLYDQVNTSGKHVRFCARGSVPSRHLRTQRGFRAQGRLEKRLNCRGQCDMVIRGPCRRLNLHGGVLSGGVLSGAKGSLSWRLAGFVPCFTYQAAPLRRRPAIPRRAKRSGRPSLRQTASNHRTTRPRNHQDGSCCRRVHVRCCSRPDY